MRRTIDYESSPAARDDKAGGDTMQQPSAQSEVTTAISTQDRRKVLQAEIRRRVSNGYRVISQTDSTAQLTKPRKFSLFWGVVLGLTFFGLVLYLLWYVSRAKETAIYIEVDDDGRVVVTGA